jgi:hypothetical protein
MLSDLLVGNVFGWQLKRVSTFWRSLLKTQCTLNSGALTNIVVLPNAGLVTSISVTFVRMNDNCDDLRRAKVDGERYTDSEAVYHYKTPCIKVVQQYKCLLNITDLFVMACL